jgi:hypothetical protein
MPILKSRLLFISHAWVYSAHYHKVVEWLNSEPNFNWRNCSVPSHNPLLGNTIRGLREGVTRQISPAQGVIILAGMYATHSDWINYEIDEAIRMNKTIIGIRPWGQERVPNKIQEAATLMVNWNSGSLIQTIRGYVK